ncbi:ATP-binding protein [Sulfuricurvum sp.]|uniref:sensor histidine kinase n=1 Tax=Sulfuricurvum sp. TaxID=2025608 RepID=UPI002624E30C|nr:ATP-binding protein [Sulfuricurvum sp.]MDD2781437.1 ATP-binding protein [Sulfuricurvum sp.]
MNLTKKLIIAILSITILIVSVFTYLQISEQRKILNDELQQRITLIRTHLESQAQSDIRSLKYEVENDLSALNFSHIDSVFTNLVNKKEIDSIVMFNHDRSQRLYSGDGSFQDRLPPIGGDTITYLDQDHFIVSTPIILTQKWGELHIIYSLESLREEVRKAQEYQKKQIQSSVEKALLTSVGLAILLLILSYLFARKLIRPILVLTETTQNIAKGNLSIGDTLTTIQSNDEIGLLSASFIDMAQKLDASYQELQELNSSLEERVSEKVKRIREQEKMMIAQSRLAAMGEIIRMIAHQWRQPLSTVTLMIANEKLTAMTNSKAPYPSENVLDKISETILYLSNMIDDFQTFFKPDKAAEPILISTLIDRTLQIIQTRLTLEKIFIEIAEYPDETIQTYTNEVIQVFINIINNAIDALREKEGNRTLHLTISHNTKEVIFSLEDNAGGIPPDILPNIFDPYFSTKSKNGTGVGLYMAKMIIERHIGGKLSAANTLEGAQFTIVLPKQPIVIETPTE